MTHEEVIKQLENLLEHCFDMSKTRINDDDNPWARDCKALEYAIEKLKGEQDGERINP